MTADSPEAKPTFLEPSQVEALALAQGFTQAKFLPNAPHVRFPSEAFEHWLQQGYHADMAWMTRHKSQRLHPATLVQEAQEGGFMVESILVVTMNYAQDVRRSDTTTPKIARYARGRDYHRVIKKRLQTLLKHLQADYPTLQGRAFTDSAPMLERAMVVQAGLAWQGKNCNIISPAHGSYLFIGSLFLSLPLEKADTFSLPVMSDLCGKCSRCIQACPTEALLEDTRQLDANKCIAYWTIEATHTTPIPDTIASKAQGWVFGCDICQEVCPWNIKFARPTTEPDFLTPKHPWQQHPTASWLSQATETTFAQAMAGTPLMRAGLQRLQHTWQQVIATH